MNNIDYKLYLVTDRKGFDEDSLLVAIGEAIKSGVTIVQLREKNLNNEDFFNFAKKVKLLTDKSVIPLIINDNIDVAIRVNANGVHVGQTDMDVTEIRKLIGDNKIIGLTVQNVAQAIEAESKGADYIGVGSIYNTFSKLDAGDAIGIDTLKTIVSSVKIPVVAIGGITETNVADVVNTQVSGVALISALLQSKYGVCESTRRMNMIINNNLIALQVADIIENIKEEGPLVYHLTNTVTINDCANVTLAIGASPIMSFGLDDLQELIGFSASVVINIGTMEQNIRELSLAAGKLANKLNKPIVLDPVGCGATQSRMNLVKELISNIKFSVIKANMGEAKAILGFNLSNNSGVDSSESEDNIVEVAKSLAKFTGAIAVITGIRDIVSDGCDVYEINNGSPLMKKVTGTGCMTASLIASCIGIKEYNMTNVVAGVVIMGVSGQIAADNLSVNQGNASLRNMIIDNVYLTNREILVKYASVIKK